MNTNEQDLIEELKQDGVILVMDNDMCFTRYEDDEEAGESYDFTPNEVVFILCGLLGIEAESV